MQPLLALARLIDRINAFIGKGVIWLILLAVLVSAGNAVSRKLFNLSSNAWLELQWYLFGAAFMGAAAYTLQQNEHIRIDVFYASRSRKTQHWIDLLGHIFFLLPFAALMAWLLWPYTIQAFYSGQISTTPAVCSSGPPAPSCWQALSAGLSGIGGNRQENRRDARVNGRPHPFISAQDQALKEAEELAAEVAAAAEVKK